MAAALSPNVSSAAESGELAQMQWLVGVWRSQVPGGQVEEVFEPGNNGELLSTMKMVVGGKVTRYELRSIREKDGKIIFQELGFGADMAALDPVPVRTLESIDATHINFEGVKLTRTGEDAMTVNVTVRNPDGTTRVINFNSARALKFAPL
ncbi:MAG: DUF6265 family protein [Steroidobacterales bacterium]